MSNYTSEFLSISLLEGRDTVYFLWSDATANLTDESFRAELRQQTKAIQESKPTFVLLNTRKFVFPILPTTQAWVDTEIYPVWAAAGVTKIAIIMSAEFMAQLSIEQAFEENTQTGMVSSFFETEEEAKKWFSA